MSFKDQPLGTIIASILNYDQFNASLPGEAQGFHAKTSSYAPCDGRSIAGSALGKIITGTTANNPDLRGKFIRGLNLFHLEGQPAFHIELCDPDGVNRYPSHSQGDEIREHVHSYNVTYPASVPNKNTNGGGGASGGADSTNATGGKETRPKNIAVYYYIKIN